MSDPLFPCSASGFIPNWCVRLDGGELEGGRTVYVTDYHMTKAPVRYRDETHPHHSRFDGTREEQIEQEMNRAVHDIEALWGEERPYYIVPPDYSASKLSPGSWSSPQHRCFAWLSSSPLDPEKHGSHLILIWWQEGGDAREAEMWKANCPTMIEAVERILQTIEWGDLARDYYI